MSFEKLEAERDVLTRQAHGDIPKGEACRRERDEAEADLARVVEEIKSLKNDRDVLETKNSLVVQ